MAHGRTDMALMKTWISDKGIVFKDIGLDKWIEIQPSGKTFTFDFIEKNQWGVRLKRGDPLFPWIQTWVWIGETSLNVNDTIAFYKGNVNDTIAFI